MYIHDSAKVLYTSKDVEENSSSNSEEFETLITNSYVTDLEIYNKNPLTYMEKIKTQIQEMDKMEEMDKNEEMDKTEEIDKMDKNEGVDEIDKLDKKSRNVLLVFF